MSVAVHAREPRFLFFWNNKVASRSLLAALGDAFPEVDTYAQSAFRPPRRDGDWPRFLIVRSPWARAASAFRNKCRDAGRSVDRHGALEPCQHHLLAALGFRAGSPKEGAERLAALTFNEFVELLPVVRDGNSHFRLQVDVLRHGGEARGPMGWAMRSLAAGLHVARTHYRMPASLRVGLDGRHVEDGLAAYRSMDVHTIRLEELPEAWSVVEEALGRSVALPWHTRTAKADDWMDLYDEGSRDAVGRLYRADAEAFGYGAP